MSGGRARVKIGVVDYGMGNLHSVSKALEEVGGEVRLVRGVEELSGVDGLVLPGVGHFGDGMRELRARGLEGPVREWVEAGRCFLGICLGMQMLMEWSEEAPGEKGLGVCRGGVKRFRFEGMSLKVPQMGWNRVWGRVGCPLFDGVEDGSYVYFVHSYYVAPEDTELIGGETEYGIRYCAVLWRGELYATQFHPEKSQRVGLHMLRNFVKRVEAQREER